MKRGLIVVSVLISCSGRGGERGHDTPGGDGVGSGWETGEAGDTDGTAEDSGTPDTEDTGEPEDPEPEGWVLHVSTSGDDAHDGSEDAPLASLSGARDAIRERRGTGALDEGATVVLHSGTYSLRATFELDAQDSGTETSPIVYRAATDAVVRISGGQALEASGFRPVTDAAVLDRLVDTSVRGRLLEFDLQGAGISDHGEISRRGYNLGWSSDLADPPMELVIDDQVMSLASWPNDAPVTLSSVVDPGPVRGDPDFWTRGGTFGHDLDRTVHWPHADDIWIEGTLGRDWEWTHNRVAAVDADARQITLAHGEVSGILNWQPFFVFRNLLEEIDVPGEYFIDRDNGMLYLLPPDGFGSSSRVVVSVLQDDLVRLDGADHVSFRGLIFEDGREHGIHGADADSLLIEDCTFRNLGMDAALMVGTGNALRRSDIRGVGRRGVFAGPMPWGWPEDGIYSAADHRNVVADNVFEDVGRLYLAYYPAVDVDGVGSRVRNNRIRSGPHMGIQIRGNDHVIEYNDISEIGLVFKDIGAIYSNLGKLPGERGSLIRRNFIHHLGQDKDKLFGVYLDNGTMGVTVEENIFYAIGSAETPRCAAIMSNHGQHLVVRNNLMIDTTQAFRLSFYLNCDGSEIGWGCAGQSGFVSAWDGYFDAVPSDHELAYPELAGWGEEDHWEPTTNRFHRNVVYNPEISLVSGAYGVAYASEGFTLDASDNWVATSDPGIASLESMDFSQLASGDMFAQVPGLRSIPFDHIGPGGLGTPVEVPVHADAHVSSGRPDESAGEQADVVMSRDQGEQGDQVSYLQVGLDEIDGPVDQAELYVYARVPAYEASSLVVHAVDDDDWDDAARAPTWASRPTVGSALGSTLVSSDRYAWVGFDVTAFVASERSGDGVASFALQVEPGSGATVLGRAREQGPAGGVPRAAFLRVRQP